jgi:threonine aldolase
MLQAIAQSTLMDDVYQEDTTTTDLEAHMASLTGKEDALLVMSGTMGNQIALRSLLTQPPHAILCHHKSHILLSEAGGCSSLSQAHMQPVQPSNDMYLTLEDVKREAVISNNIHRSPTRVISLENTLGGVITPLVEVQRISRFARENNILMHLDGARIWEAVAAGAGSLTDFLSCFDTAQLCFSKGLGAPIGSIIVGPKKTLEHCRWVRKTIGGGIRQAGIISSAARIAVDEQFGKGPKGEGGRLRKTHEIAKKIESMWLERGGKVSRLVQTNMVYLDLGYSGVSVPNLIAAGREEGIKLMSARIVVHYQIADEAVVKLGKAMDRVLRAKTQESEDGQSIYK